MSKAIKVLVVDPKIKTIVTVIPNNIREIKKIVGGQELEELRFYIEDGKNTFIKALLNAEKVKYHEVEQKMEIDFKSPFVVVATDSEQNLHSMSKAQINFAKSYFSF